MSSSVEGTTALILEEESVTRYKSAALLVSARFDRLADLARFFFGVSGCRRKREGRKPIHERTQRFARDEGAATSFSGDQFATFYRLVNLVPTKTGSGRSLVYGERKQFDFVVHRSILIGWR